MPKFLFNVGRNPVLYVSGDSVFRGPPEPHFLSNRAGTSLPAAAIESEPDIHFLEQLESPCPRSSKRGWKRCAYGAIRCRLQTIEDTGGPEVCILKPSALSADDRIRWQWMLHAWNRVGGRSTEPAGEATSAIPLYDESLLRAAQTAIQTLGVRTGLNVPGVYLRVTKTFPETFTAWLRSLPSGVEVELEGELQSLLQDAVAGRIRLDLTEADIDWFDLRVVLDVSDTSLTPQEIKLLLDAKGAFVRLKDRGWPGMQFDLTPRTTSSWPGSD